jgi:hypothetical protein
MFSVTRRTMVGSRLATALSVSPFLRTAKAETYPRRPVKIIVPYAAGGASDIIARLIAPEFARATRRGAKRLTAYDVIAITRLQRPQYRANTGFSKAVCAVMNVCFES